MKRLVLTIAILGTLSAQAAKVECVKEGRNYVPSNDLAKKIASSLGVKTCRGDRFKAVVAKLGYDTNVPAAKKNMTVDEVIASLK